ncbi:MAG: 6-bladed beta-propeller [bacterium]|nr:6-bladed beta-propeller [bacterium]
MKRIISSLIMMTVILSATASARDVPTIENPAVPANKNAGRTITLNEVLRFDGDSDDYYFKRPYRLKVAPDESIFLIDDKQFLRFDKNGTFIKNHQKKGEGPGEYNNLTNYFFVDNGITLFTRQPFKMIKTDMQGKLLKENRIIMEGGFFSVLGLHKDKYWAANAGFSAWGKPKTGYTDINRDIVWGTDGSKTNKSKLAFTEKAYMVSKSAKGNVSISLNIFVVIRSVMDQNGQLYVSNTQKYNIKKVNLEKETITNTFNRKYKSIPFKEEINENENSRSTAPEPEFFNDVQRIHFHKDRLWVFTSTIIKDKGILVDVFSKDGKYMDNFYLPLHQVETPHDFRRTRTALYKNFLFTIEEDEDENPVIVKYEMNM